VSSIFGYIGKILYDSFSASGDSPAQNQPTNGTVKAVDDLVKLKNVVGILEAQGPLAEETIVIGAHYDHLGMRKFPRGKTVVFHGANDNASGVATMLETAQILAQRGKKLPRRIVFVAFSGEESGLLGSFHYVNDPPVPLEKTIAMINLDVVGRMEGDNLMSFGAPSSPTLSKMTGKVVKQHQLNLKEMSQVFAGSDHVPFYAYHIPVVFLLTEGGRGDYHRPSDRANTLNYSGMRKIAQITADLSVELSEADKPPDFAEEGVSSFCFRILLRLWGSMSD
jgi:Zn-dependent M28 family amino/carboxypeptidase